MKVIVFYSVLYLFTDTRLQ